MDGRYCPYLSADAAYRPGSRLANVRQHTDPLLRLSDRGETACRRAPRWRVPESAYLG